MGRGKPRFSYGGDPAASDTDAVRFLVGDTNDKRPLLDDREVDFALSQHPNKNLAAAVLCEHLFGRFAGVADLKVGPVSKSFSKVADLFNKKAQQLRSEACKTAVPSFPATMVASKQALDLDDSLTRPNFLIGISDNPFAVQINANLDRTDWHGF